MRALQNRIMTEKPQAAIMVIIQNFVLKGTVPLRTKFSQPVLKGTVLLRTNCSVDNGGIIDYKIRVIFA